MLPPGSMAIFVWNGVWNNHKWTNSENERIGLVSNQLGNNPVVMYDALQNVYRIFVLWVWEDNYYFPMILCTRCNVHLLEIKAFVRLVCFISNGWLFSPTPLLYVRWKLSIYRKWRLNYNSRSLRSPLQKTKMFDWRWSICASEHEKYLQRYCKNKLKLLPIPGVSVLVAMDAVTLVLITNLPARLFHL